MRIGRPSVRALGAAVALGLLASTAEASVASYVTGPLELRTATPLTYDLSTVTVKFRQGIGRERIAGVVSESGCSVERVSLYTPGLRTVRIPEGADFREMVAHFAARADDGGPTSLAALPTPTGAQLTFSLSADAAVTATVLNVAGGPIRTIAVGKPLEAGVQTLLWDRNADTGLPVPAGLYIIRVTARSEDGAESNAMATMALR